MWVPGWKVDLHHRLSRELEAGLDLVSIPVEMATSSSRCSLRSAAAAAAAAVNHKPTHEHAAAAPSLGKQALEEEQEEQGEQGEQGEQEEQSEADALGGFSEFEQGLRDFFQSRGVAYKVCFVFYEGEI